MATGAEPGRHLLHVFSTFAVGGPQTRFVSLANALGRKYRHSILAMDGNLTAAEGLAGDVPYTLETMAVRKTGWISVANLKNARHTMRRLKPDLLLTYNWGAIEWSLANWPRLCRHIHLEDGFGPDESPSRQDRRRVLMRRLLLSHGTQIVVPSATLFALATEVWRLPRQNVLHLPNGIDCARFARPPDAALLAELGLAGEGPVIGTVAALRREKNLALLIRAVAALPPELGTRLAIVGDGPERPALVALAAQAGIAARVIFTGALREPERVLGRFDVFALSSDTEQMPNAVLEAMAAALPIAGTDVGDVKRMVAAANAPFIVPAGDAVALARALGGLLGDRELRLRLGRANAQRVRAEYALETMVERYDSLFSAPA
jgi:L-malate glycosyltransferase